MRNGHDRAQSSTATQTCYLSTWVNEHVLGGKLLSHFKYVSAAYYGLDIVSASNHVPKLQSFM